jgi:hypothetical protein
MELCATAAGVAARRVGWMSHSVSGLRMSGRVRRVADRAGVVVVLSACDASAKRGTQFSLSASTTSGAAREQVDALFPPVVASSAAHLVRVEPAVGLIGRKYVENGRLVTVFAQWGVASRGETHGGPRNVLIRRTGGEFVVRPFRGLRKVPT